MRRVKPLQLSIIALGVLVAACTHPISREARLNIDPQTTLAMVSDDPAAFLNQQLMVGGVVMTTESSAEGSILEVMEWRLNRWGEPLYLDDAGRRFLARASEELDPQIYEPGTLVTLSGIVRGREVKLSGEHEYDYPVFEITEIHLWDIPFRYGIHSTSDPSYPYYTGQDKPHSHPYNPDYNPYPYTQHWYRKSD